MIYLTAIALTPGGSSTVHILHTKQNIEQHKQTNNTYNNTLSSQNNILNKTIHELGRVRTLPRLCEVYPGICLTTEEKAQKNLSEGSQMKTEYTEQSIHNNKHNNKNT
jgi:hypothetical protein